MNQCAHWCGNPLFRVILTKRSAQRNLGNSNPFSPALLIIQYGKAISALGSHANINPLRYRGYVYDVETGLYYLQSRYYDPTLGRFLNADGMATTGQGFNGNNMFAYCLNCPTNYLDNDGKDAVWLHEKDSANDAGHSGLLVQAPNGKWYFFYWGPTNEEPTGKEFLLMITEGVPCNCVFVEVTVDDVDISTIAGVKEVLANSKNDFVKERAEKITQIIYLDGDYSETYNYLDKLSTDSNDPLKAKKYHLLDNNCGQQTCYALSLSDGRFQLVSNPLIPNVVYSSLCMFVGNLTMR